MTKISNTSEGPIGLPDGQVIQPGQTVDVDSWAEMKDHPVIAGRLEAEELKVGALPKEPEKAAEKAPASASHKK